jgi:hypothetical protein
MLDTGKERKAAPEKSKRFRLPSRTPIDTRLVSLYSRPIERREESFISAWSPAFRRLGNYPKEKTA